MNRVIQSSAALLVLGTMSLPLATYVVAGQEAGPETVAAEESEVNKSSFQLLSVVRSLKDYAAERDGTVPDSVEQLVQSGDIDQATLVSPMKPAVIAGPDYTFRLTSEGLNSFDGQYIVGIDRAAYTNLEKYVSVAYADSHVDVHRRDEVDHQLALPLNEGARKDLRIENVDRHESSIKLFDLYQAIYKYAANNDYQPPASLKQLVDAGYASSALFRSPMGPAADGGKEYAVRLTKESVESFDGTYIVGLDRAAFINGEPYCSVLFADCHVDVLDRAQIDELFKKPQNKELRERFELE